MFDQANDQNQQQSDNQASDNPQQPNPAAPPPDHDFAPKPAYESVFDEQPAGTGNGGSLSADNNSSDDQTQTPQDVSQPTPQDLPPSGPVKDDELLGIKQQALQELSPLVGKLEQDPEEKFHTTMRIIQASDNHELIKEAYQAARQIDDEKVRAQALLDIVNEINYFTKTEAHGSAEEGHQEA